MGGVSLISILSSYNATFYLQDVTLLTISIRFLMVPYFIYSNFVSLMILLEAGFLYCFVSKIPLCRRVPRLYIHGILDCSIHKYNAFFVYKLWNDPLSPSNAALFAFSYNAPLARWCVVMALSSSVFINTNSAPFLDTLIRDFFWFIYSS